MNLAERRCVPCEGGTMPLGRQDAEKLLLQIPGWTIAPDGKSLTRQFVFKNFVQAMAFANKITPVAEEEGHHPDLTIGWGRVVVELSTHSIGGLSESDYILAAKISVLAEYQREALL